MSGLPLDIAFVATATLLGAAAGWWLRGSGRDSSRASSAPHSADSSPAAPPDEETAPEVSVVQTMLGRLQQLTQSVAADVGKHQSRVREINSDLTAESPVESGVVAAVRNLIRANETMQTQLSTAEERLQVQTQELGRYMREARTDALTRLFNRRAFDDEVRQCVESMQRTGRPSCLLLVDLDRFKKFNDLYGHATGDAVLRGVAEILRAELEGDEVLCRYGGEEFSVIFPDADLDSVRRRAENLRAAVGRKVLEFDGLDLRVTASSGLAQLRPDETSEELFSRCDEALYAAKGQGRDRGCWHDGTAVRSIEDGGCPTEQPPHPRPISPDTPAAAGGEDGADLSDHDTFLADVERRIAAWKRGGQTLSVVLLRLDRLEKIEGEWGPGAKQLALRAVAQFLQASLREMDHVARLEDGTFAALLPGLQLHEAGDTAERVRSDVAHATLRINNRQRTVTISAGLSEVTHSDAAEDLLERARKSLEAAQRAGGNCCFLASKAENPNSSA